MSEYTYQDNVQRGVTGPDTETCLLASPDRVSDTFGIRPATYEHYTKVRQDFLEQCGDGSNYVPPEIIKDIREVQTAYYKDLGVYTTRNIICAREDSEKGLRTRLARLSLGGFRIAVFLDTGGPHTVGIKQVEGDWYDVRSTSSPFNDDEPVAVSDIFSYLDRCPRIRRRPNTGRNTVKEPNIVALPPEPN